MWGKLFRAEWLKITGNRWAAGCMIWVFPALAVLATIFALLAAGLSSSFRAEIGGELEWNMIATIPWMIPNNPLGRMLLIGFTAVIFAGEYQWNTWKVIVPRSQRVPLILVKFFTVAVFVVFAFALMSILLTLGMGLVSLAAGVSYGPALGSHTLANFAGDYSRQVFNAIMVTTIAAGYAALAAMITRSIVGSVIIGVVISIGEALIVLPLYLIADLLNTDSILNIYRYLPSYNLNNLFIWLSGDTPQGLGYPSDKVIVDSQRFSEVVLVCWVIGLVVLTVYLFQRQDVTN
jgi:ABC-2 type transport system permease protein